MGSILRGRKTIFTGLVMVIAGVSMYALGEMELPQAVEMVGTGLGLIFLRLGIKE